MVRRMFLRSIVGVCLLSVAGPLLAQGRPGGPRGPRPEPSKAAATKAAIPGAWLKQMTWRSIGPANMSGRIPAMAVNPKDHSNWWIASASGGLLKTTNNGITFEHQFDHEATVSIGDVEVAASNPQIVWVGTGEANPRNSVSWGDGVYKSVDGGKTWKNMGLKKAFQIGRIAIHPKDPNIVYVGALGRLWGPSNERGLYKTTDGGKTWNRILFVDDKTGVIDVQMNPKKPNELLVATYERMRDGTDANDPIKKFGPGSALYRTVDGGKTFKKSTKGLPNVEFGRMGISYYAKDPKHVYLILESRRIGQWPPKAAYAGIQGQNADVGARLTQVVDKGPAAKAGLKKGDIIISVDGETVHSYADLLTNIRKRQAGDKVKIEVSRDRKSVDVELTLAKRPESKSQRSRRQPSTPEEKLRSGSPYAASLGGQTANLQDQQGPDAHQYGGVYHSADGGVSWTRINSVNPRPMYYSQIRVDPSNNQFIWALGTRLYLSKDGGKTFTTDGTAQGVHSDNHSMWIDPADGRHILLGTDGGLYVTYDRGAHWDHHNHIAIGQFYHVTVGPRRDYHVYGGLQDNGSWGGPSRGNSGSGPINSDWIRIGGGDGFVCLVDPNDPDLIYSESQGGATGRVNLRTGERGFMRPRPPKGTTYRFNWKTPFILSPHNPKVYYSAGNHVFRSPYEGNGLKAVSPDITLTDKGAASSLAESPREEGVLYAGTTDGALWVTRNGGHDWTNLFGKPQSAEGAEEKEAEKDKEAKDDEKSPPAKSGPSVQTARSGPRPGGPGGFANMLKSRDANGDGKIQKSEFPSQAVRMFDRLDTNQDGAVDSDELKALARRFGAGRPGGRPPESRSAAPKTTAIPAGPQTKPASQESSGKKDAPEKATDKAKAVKKAAPKRATAEKDAKAAPKKVEPKKPQGVAKAAPKKVEPKKTSGDKKTEAKPVIKEDIVSGTWTGKLMREGLPEDRAKITVIFRMDAQGKVTGSFQSMMTRGEGEGKYDPKSKEVVFSVETERSTMEVIGTISGESMTGDLEINGGAFSMPFEAKRTGDAPAAEPKPEVKEVVGDPLEKLIPGPRWVSSIEASRFKAERVYITLDGHRSNDDSPYVFASEDFGTTWRSLVANLPATAGSTRVIREDPVNENVLYLGTEFAIWVSIDRGQSWVKLNNNLPTVAVHEVAIHPTAGEIVAGTHGRSLWILDVAALRQFSTETLAAPAFLYRPQPAVKWKSTSSRGASGTRRFVGANPPTGTTIYYSLAKDAKEVSLAIKDIEGTVVRELEADAKAGLHKIQWDLRTTGNRSGGGSRFGRGRSAEAGKYLVTLSVDGNELTQVVTVEDDPNE